MGEGKSCGVRQYSTSLCGRFRSSASVAPSLARTTGRGEAASWYAEVVCAPPRLLAAAAAAPSRRTARGPYASFFVHRPVLATQSPIYILRASPPTPPPMLTHRYASAPAARPRHPGRCRRGAEEGHRAVLGEPHPPVHPHCRRALPRDRIPQPPGQLPQGLSEGAGPLRAALYSAGNVGFRFALFLALALALAMSFFSPDLPPSTLSLCVPP